MFIFFFMQFWVYINLVVGRRENISLLMKDQCIPLFIHARELSARAKCSLHSAGSIVHSRGRFNDHCESCAPTVISHTHYFLSSRFACEIAFRSSYSFITELQSKETRLHQWLYRHNFFYERMQLRVRYTYSGMICRISFSIDTFFTFKVYPLT